MLVPTIAQIVGCVLNITLDHVLVLVLGYGVAGAAIATVAAQGLSALIIFAYIIMHREKFVLSFKKLKFSKENLIEIYKVCLPSTIMMSLPSLLIMGLNVVLRSINAIYVDVLNLYLKIQTFVFMPIVGLLQGVRPIIGYFYGSNKPDKLKEVLKHSVVMITIVTVLGGVLFYIIPEFIIGFFFDTEFEIALGAQAFRIFTVGFVFIGISYLFSTFYESLGYGFVSLIINLSRQFMITIVMTIILVYVFDFGAVGVWSAMVTAEVLTGIMVLLMFRYSYKNTTIFIEKPLEEAVSMSFE